MSAMTDDLSQELPPDRRRPRHRTVDRIAAILEAVASRSEGLNLTQLALRLGAPVSSIQKLVNGLVATGYLAETDRRFILGPAPHVLSLRAGRPPVRTLRHADLVELSREAGAPALAAVRVGDDAVYVDWAGADEPFDFARSTRLRTPLPDTASGRVLLAHLPERERRECVTAAYPDDPGAAIAVLTEAERIRQEGRIVGASGPLLPNASAVAVPLWEDGEVVAAVAVAGREGSVPERLPEIADMLVASSRRWAARGPVH
jgi:DNA-binding IclR family transcriptional regulator